MGKKKNIQIVASLANKITPKTALVLSDYTGVTHQQLEALRNNIKQKGGDFQIIKNSLLRMVLKDVYQVPKEDLDKISGPTAIVITSSNDPSPLSVIYQKGKELDALSLKWGIWDGAKISAERLVQLATLPAKEILLTQLVSQLKNNQTRMVLVLKGDLQKLAMIFNGIKEKKNN